MSGTLQTQFEPLMERHRNLLYKICSIYGTTPQDREDLAQEILAQLWRSFPSFDGRCLFSTWMYRVALNTAITYSRGEFRRRSYVVPAAEHVLEAFPAQPEPSEDLQLLHRLIAALDPLNRALILLYLEGHTNSEIAGILGLSEAGAAVRIHRLKAAMKQSAQTAQKETAK